MRWLLRLFTRWWFGRAPHLALEARAARVGTLTLQQIEGPDRLYWTVSLRAHRGADGRGPRYAWTAKGDDIVEALLNVLEQAREYKIGLRPVLKDAPKLGGREFDEPHVRIVPPSWDE